MAARLLAVLALLAGGLALAWAAREDGLRLTLDRDLLWSAAATGVVGALGMAVVRRLARRSGRG